MLVNLQSITMPNSKEVKAAMDGNFLSKDRFAAEVEALVLRTKMNYIDAIVVFCDQNSIELESVPKLLSKPLKEKLKFNAMELNFLKRSSRAKLPL